VTGTLPPPPPPPPTAATAASVSLHLCASASPPGIAARHCRWGSAAPPTCVPLPALGGRRGRRLCAAVPRAVTWNAPQQPARKAKTSYPRVVGCCVADVVVRLGCCWLAVRVCVSPWGAVAGAWSCVWWWVLCPRRRQLQQPMVVLPESQPCVRRAERWVKRHNHGSKKCYLIAKSTYKS
jgi:hypothetical protein